MLLRLCVEFVGGSDAYPQMISIPLLKSKVGGNFATAAISGLQLQRSLSEETAKVHKLQEKVVKHEKAFQVKSSELTWHRPNSCNFSLHLRYINPDQRMLEKHAKILILLQQMLIIQRPAGSWEMGDPVKVQVEGKKKNSTIKGQQVLLKKLRKARVNSHTLMETCCRSFTHKIQVHRFSSPLSIHLWKQNTMSLHTNSPHLVSSHINLCNFVSGHWNAGWRKSKRVSRNWWPSKSNKDSLFYNSDFSQL